MNIFNRKSNSIKVKSNIIEQASKSTNGSFIQPDEIINKSFNEQRVLASGNNCETTLAPIKEIPNDVKSIPMDKIIKNQPVFFYHLKYINDRLSINTIDTGFLVFEKDYSNLTFDDILKEIDLAKKQFVERIQQFAPGLEIPFADIQLINLNKILT